jgi:uncharacterized YigZ family protein
MDRHRVLHHGARAHHVPCGMSSDRYLTLGSGSEGLYREKASKFIAFAFPIGDEADFAQRCTLIAKEHHTCRHVCYAWVLDEAGDRYRANDAGEPTGTAGKPILRQLQRAKLTYAAIVVVRYFGGTLLGKGGLVHAYAEAAREAIAKNTIIERVVRTSLRVRCTYALVEAMKNDVAECEGEMITADYTERCDIVVAIARSRVAAFVARWQFAGATVGPDQPK